MGIFDKLFGTTQEAVEPVTQEVTPVAPQMFTKVNVSKELRQGMWVYGPQGVAILTSFAEDGTPVITYQKDDGTTKIVLNEQDQPIPATETTAEIRQAYVEEIPTARKTSAEALFVLGYQYKAQ